MELKAVRFEVFKSSGPGGQHKNKSLTAVKAIHVPTGLAAVGQETRSQSQNKELALARLAAKVKKLYFRPRPRVATKTTRGAQERRLEVKRKHALKKKARREKFEVGE